MRSTRTTPRARFSRCLFAAAIAQLVVAIIFIGIFAGVLAFASSRYVNYSQYYYRRALLSIAGPWYTPPNFEALGENGILLSAVDLVANLISLVCAAILVHDTRPLYSCRLCCWRLQLRLRAALHSPLHPPRRREQRRGHAAAGLGDPQPDGRRRVGLGVGGVADRLPPRRRARAARHRRRPPRLRRRRGAVDRRHRSRGPPRIARALRHRQDRRRRDRHHRRADRGGEDGRGGAARSGLLPAGRGAAGRRRGRWCSSSSLASPSASACTGSSISAPSATASSVSGAPTGRTRRAAAAPPTRRSRSTSRRTAATPSSSMSCDAVADRCAARRARGGGAKATIAARRGMTTTAR